MSRDSRSKQRSSLVCNHSSLDRACAYALVSFSVDFALSVGTFSYRSGFGLPSRARAYSSHKIGKIGSVRIYERVNLYFFLF